jgi:hypothetical protein
MPIPNPPPEDCPPVSKVMSGIEGFASADNVEHIRLITRDDEVGGGGEHEASICRYG